MKTEGFVLVDVLLIVVLLVAMTFVFAATLKAHDNYERRLAIYVKESKEYQELYRGLSRWKTETDLS